MFFLLELTPPSALVRETLNTSKTVQACVTFLRYVKPTVESKQNGETKEKPFLEIVALLDLQPGVNGFAGTAHGGLYGVVLDECMGTVTNMQAGMFHVRFINPFSTQRVHSQLTLRTIFSISNFESLLMVCRTRSIHCLP